MKKIFRSPKALLPVCLIGVACSSARLKIRTEPPDAEVFVSQQDASHRETLGHTPLEISYRDLQEKVGVSGLNNDFIYLTIEEKDHETVQLLMPATVFGNRVMSAEVRLKAREYSKEANQILQRLHNAQSLATDTQYDRAMEEVDKALLIDPKFARTLSMKASIYYLQKNYADSLKFYEQALAIDPALNEAIRMIAKIKGEKK